MKSSVAVWALVITLGGVFVGANKVQAENEILEDSKVCGVAVGFAMQYMNSTDAQEIHKGAWSILMNKNLDDAQKLITLATYHTIQEIAWRNMGRFTNTEEANAFWKIASDRTKTECEYALNRIRFPNMI